MVLICNEGHEKSYQCRLIQNDKCPCSRTTPSCQLGMSLRFNLTADLPLLSRRSCRSRPRSKYWRSMDPKQRPCEITFQKCEAFGTFNLIHNKYAVDSFKEKEIKLKCTDLNESNYKLSLICLHVHKIFQTYPALSPSSFFPPLLSLES